MCGVVGFFGGDSHSDKDGGEALNHRLADKIFNRGPDGISVKIDRAATGISLQTSVPCLGHRIVEFAWTLPQTIKLRAAQSKWPLRQIVYRQVPRELIERPRDEFLCAFT